MQKKKKKKCNYPSYFFQHVNLNAHIFICPNPQLRKKSRGKFLEKKFGMEQLSSDISTYLFLLCHVKMLFNLSNCNAFLSLMYDIFLNVISSY